MNVYGCAVHARKSRRLRGSRGRLSGVCGVASVCLFVVLLVAWDGCRVEAATGGALLRWKNMRNVTTSAGMVRRTNAPPSTDKWNAGVTSDRSMEGYSFKVHGQPDMFVGMSLMGRDRMYPTDIDYAIELRKSGFAYASERGVSKKFLTNYVSGDEFKIIRNLRAVMRIYYNDKLVYESPTTWTLQFIGVHIATADNVNYIYQATSLPADPLTFPEKCFDESSCPDTRAVFNL